MSTSKISVQRLNASTYRHCSGSPAERTDHAKLRFKAVIKAEIFALFPHVQHDAWIIGRSPLRMKRSKAGIRLIQGGIKISEKSRNLSQIDSDDTLTVEPRTFVKKRRDENPCYVLD
ncbi:hypothetical protein K443DRAFT_121399 [Laccaria amethystina LaAM-08-1]|uniref:Uncharacterized protein n=1 Tax=Laccaria amethystina LaAM-08-1 TaxID=1095629 RepID=A0A0C9Y6H3_9AGAR|nr:hypothetical protein K443DRAFT_121399 [Laccaria amethystina LaAM-08-1]